MAKRMASGSTETEQEVDCCFSLLPFMDVFPTLFPNAERSKNSCKARHEVKERKRAEEDRQVTFPR